jgi:hypothetical protein
MVTPPDVYAVVNWHDPMHPLEYLTSLTRFSTVLWALPYDPGATDDLNDVISCPVIVSPVLATAPMFDGVAWYKMALFNLAGVMSLAVVLVPAWYSASVILEYVVFIHAIICQYVPSYKKATTDPAFHDEAALVLGAVVPYLMIDFAPVLLTFNVGLATPFALVNFTYTRVPVDMFVIFGDTVTSFAAVAAAVEHSP